jgi:hypothetical protein
MENEWILNFAEGRRKRSFFPAARDGEYLPPSSGVVRSYHTGPLRGSVYDRGEVYYQYHRSLNPVLVGVSGGLLAGRSQVDCTRVRGREARSSVRRSPGFARTGTHLRRMPCPCK